MRTQIVHLPKERSSLYKDFFGYKVLPFENTPDPDFFYMGAGYRDILALMKHGVITRKGILSIVGPIGCGKTTLANALIANLPETALVISVFTPQTSAKDLVGYIAQCLEIQDIPDSLLALHSTVRDKLVRITEEDRHCVLIIDESQLMKDVLFQEILFLANLETSKCKLIQIVLLGQMELLHRLDEPRMHQLAQRIAVMQIIEPMSDEQSKQYIEHRLKVSGGPADPYSDDALFLIIKTADGIPRVINKLCDTALLKAFIAQRKTVEEEDVQAAIQEMGLNEFTVKRRNRHHRPYTNRIRHPGLFSEPVEKAAHTPEESSQDNVKKNGSVEKSKQKANIIRIQESVWLRSILILLIITFLLSGIVKNCSSPATQVQDDTQISINKRSGNDTKHRYSPIAVPNTTTPLQSPGTVSGMDTLPASPESMHPTLSESDTIAAFSTHDSYFTAVPKAEKTKFLPETNDVPPPPVDIEIQSTEPARQAPPEVFKKTSYPYSILLGSYRSQADADRALSIFKDRGISPYWSRANLGGNRGVWYRVFSGYYKTADLAKTVIQMKQLTGAIVKRTAFAAMIGTYYEADEMYLKMDELREIGYSSYSIKNNDTYNLYVGAFYTPDGSTTQCSELMAAKINCLPTKR